MERIPHTKNWMQDIFNVQGKKKCTDQYQEITFSYRKAVGDAKKIKSDQCHGNGSPDKGTAFLFQEKSDNRDNDNIAGSDEAGFSYGSIFDAELLKIAGCKECDSA